MGIIGKRGSHFILFLFLDFLLGMAIGIGHDT